MWGYLYRQPAETTHEEHANLYSGQGSDGFPHCPYRIPIHHHWTCFSWFAVFRCLAFQLLCVILFPLPLIYQPRYGDDDDDDP